MKESELYKSCIKAISILSNVRIFRNNVGTGWVGKEIHLKPGQKIVARGGEVLLINARPLHAGLVKGSGDGVGWRTIEITPDMVGRKIAQFCSLEAKTKNGRLSQEQKTWLRNVEMAGGLAIVGRDPEEVVDSLKGEV